MTYNDPEDHSELYGILYKVLNISLMSVCCHQVRCGCRRCRQGYETEHMSSVKAVLKPISVTPAPGSISRPPTLSFSAMLHSAAPDFWLALHSVPTVRLGKLIA